MWHDVDEPDPDDTRSPNVAVASTKKADKKTSASKVKKKDKKGHKHKHGDKKGDKHKHGGKARKKGDQHMHGDKTDKKGDKRKVIVNQKAPVKVVSNSSQFKDGREFIEALKVKLQSAISENSQSDKFDGVRKCVYKFGSDFSGLGTDHIALARAGITISQSWASEQNSATRKLLRATIGKRVKIFHDVMDRDISDLPDSVDLYAAGPSCPPWSGIGRKTLLVCYSLAPATQQGHSTCSESLSCFGKQAPEQYYTS
jgi:hypothetical protein